MKFYIRAMSETKKEVERELKPRAVEVIEHIMKLVLMPNHSSVNHWKKEIAMQLHEIDKLKGTNKWPTASQILSWTYGKRVDLLTDVEWMSYTMQDICESYDIETDLSAEEFSHIVNNICKEYFAFVANRLSTVGRVLASSVYEELDKLLNRYL